MIEVKDVEEEIARLEEVYADIPENKKVLIDGLIEQAARLRVSLTLLWRDICEKGDVELFTQSDKTLPYERERPAARLFNARDKNYQSIIKQLNELLPEGQVTDEGEALMNFVTGGKR